MSALVETQECFPKPISISGLLRIPAPKPNHEACSGGHTQTGLLGGWVCPCPCHHKAQEPSTNADNI